MSDYLSRAGKTILIIVIVVGTLNMLHKWPNKEQEGVVVGQTPEIKADIPQNAPQVELRVQVTAYCPCKKCCGKWADGQTASGYWIQPGDRFVAAPKHIPFGTKLIVPGYNNDQPVEVKDRGGAITVQRLDVFFDTHQEALNWGVKYLEIKQ